MGLSYIWDTNTVIYYFNKQFPLSGEKFIDDLLNNYRLSISIITEIELLCWRSASDNDIIILKKFISDVRVYELDHTIKLKTIEIRKHYNLKLPDAIIAASAIVNNNILVSRNLADFSRISTLEVINPFQIEL